MNRKIPIPKLNRPWILLGLLVALGALSGCAEDRSDGSAQKGRGGNGSASADGSLGAFAPPKDPGRGGFLVTVSGEDLASVGYDWRPGITAKAPAFVDGWALKFEHVLITVDTLSVNEDPDRNEGDPRQLGAAVASARGPWAIDAAIGGDVIGKSGEKAVAIAAFSEQASGAAFDPESTYAFSYDLVSASADAKWVNLDASGQALYEEAIRKGWSMVLDGTATYNGPEGSSVFAKMPKELHFTLGLTNPSSYVNCRNTDLTEVGGEFPRGIKASAEQSQTVQITIHTDHVFWDTLNVEGAQLHFDPIAALSSNYGSPDAAGQVTNEDLASADVSGFKTRDGDPLPARSLVPDYEAPAGQLRYDTNGTSLKSVNSFLSFLSFSAASGGHLNADGECEIKNNFTP